MNKVYFAILNLSSALFILFLYFFIRKYSADALGGSLVFIPLTALFLIISAWNKALARTLFHFELSIFGLIALNLCRYLESIQIRINGIFEMFFFIIFLSIFNLTSMSNLKLKINMEDNKKKLRDQISLILFLPLAISFPFIMIFAALSDIRVLSQSFSVVNVLILLVNLGFIFCLIYLYKISESDLMKILKIEEIKLKRNEIKKFAFWILISIFFLGSLCEYIRGFWFTWINTMIMIILISFITWKIKRPILED